MLSFPTSLILTFIFMLLSMAFFTLLEQKILGYSQLRKGPNKVSLMGLPQPLADALKLFSKELTFPTMSNKMIFMLSPFMTLVMAIMLWVLMPSPSPILVFYAGVLFFLCVSSMSVYTILASGWSSNSKYSLMGSLRSIAQTVSYEVSMSIIMFSPLMFLSSLDTMLIFNMNLFLILLVPIMFIMWFSTMLAETNRTPFDLTEGESELVSGFNTEFSGGLFTIIFMAEYLNILFMSLMSTLMFMFIFKSMILTLTFTLFISYMFIWIRATLPRMRYDFLMNLTWKLFLPSSLVFLMLPFMII